MGTPLFCSLINPCSLTRAQSVGIESKIDEHKRGVLVRRRYWLQWTLLTTQCSTKNFSRRLRYEVLCVNELQFDTTVYNANRSIFDYKTCKKHTPSLHRTGLKKKKKNQSKLYKYGLKILVVLKEQVRT